MSRRISISVLTHADDSCSIRGDDHVQDDQELADATHSEGEDALTDDQDSDSKLYFKCHHCSSFYTSQKSLDVNHRPN